MKKVILAIAALGFAGAAVAQDVEDTNGDGVYSMDELMVAYPDLTEEVFVTIDANGDGAVDADELAAAQEAGTLMQ
ncbi:MAG: EF-hand domain-containing protein [Paracoccaceae bacterium]|nr:EF-hand domain-containing protein [Paracoccaceae bacterium]